jgi:hypothetical protein
VGAVGASGGGMMDVGYGFRAAVHDLDVFALAVIV